MGNVLHLQESEFTQEVTNANQLVIVDFYADWCGPCKMLSPVLEEVANTNAGKVKIAKLNVDNARSKAMEYGISSIPCVVFFKNGQEVERVVGLRGKDDYQGLINKLS